MSGDAPDLRDALTAYMASHSSFLDPEEDGCEEAAAVRAALAASAPSSPHKHLYRLLPVWKRDMATIDSWWWCVDHPHGEWVRIEDDAQAAEAIPGWPASSSPANPEAPDVDALAEALMVIPIPETHAEWLKQRDRSYLSDAEDIAARYVEVLVRRRESGVVTGDAAPLDNAHSYAADPSPSGEAATAGETTGFVKVLGPSLRPSPPAPEPLNVERLVRVLAKVLPLTDDPVVIAAEYARAYANQEGGEPRYPTELNTDLAGDETSPPRP